MSELIEDVDIETIAKFMDWRVNYMPDFDEIDFHDNEDCIVPAEIDNWWLLMKVIEKIEAINIGGLSVIVSVSSKFVRIKTFSKGSIEISELEEDDDCNYIYQEGLFNFKGDGKAKATLKAVVKFIEWYS